jgi:hypothetical protein
VAIHDVHMKPVGPCGFGPRGFRGELAKVSGKNGWCDENWTRHHDMKISLSSRRNATQAVWRFRQAPQAGLLPVVCRQETSNLHPSPVLSLPGITSAARGRADLAIGFTTCTIGLKQSHAAKLAEERSWFVSFHWRAVVSFR